jgi:hypothetical protein
LQENPERRIILSEPKKDNSKMSNLMWDYKNEVLKETAHLKLNLELMEIDKWNLEKIESRI